jgi:hypothetical protein
MTIRDCYARMFDLTNPQTIRPPAVAACTNTERPLDCLADTSLLDSYCWCQGDLCNFSIRHGPPNFILNFIGFYIIFIFYSKR